MSFYTVVKSVDFGRITKIACDWRAVEGETLPPSETSPEYFLQLERVSWFMREQGNRVVLFGQGYGDEGLYLWFASTDEAVEFCEHLVYYLGLIR